MFTKDRHSRRSFLGTMASATVGLTMLGKPAKGGVTPPSVLFEVDANVAMKAEEWLKVLEGKKYPVCYDMHEHKDGWAMIWANVYLMTNPDEKNLGVCIVMRHGGFPFALKNAMWEKYRLGEFLNVIDKNTNAPSVRNMYLEPTGKDFPAPGLQGITGLQKSGVNFCVCNMALKVYAAELAAARGFDGNKVYEDFMNNLVAGIQVVPSGVWALGRIQHAPLSYGYINAG